MIWFISKSYDSSQKINWFESRRKNIWEHICVIQVTQFMTQITWFESWTFMIWVRVQKANQRNFNSVWFESDSHVIWIKVFWLESHSHVIWIKESWNHSLNFLQSWFVSCKLCDLNHTSRISFLQNLRWFWDSNIVTT